MSHANEIIVLDDDEDEGKTLRPFKANASPCHSSKQTNGKEEESSGSQSKAESISAQNKALFKEFVDYCSKLTSEHPEVILFLQGKYDKANPSYVSSVEFRNTLGRCLTRVQTKRSKIFVYINELCTALKANTQKRKVSLLTQATQQPAAEKTEALTEDDGEAENAPEKKTGSKRQIRYLENLLRIYSLEIHKLQEKELTLEELEDEDSSYIQESRLKRKLLRIFEKLCDIKDCSSLTGRVIEQRILYRGTRYPEINRRLEKFINSSRDLFPDYGDVLRVVERANDKHRLGLSRKQMQSMAQDAFRELGNKLQDRRHLDMIYNFGCHLTDPYKSVLDPAQQDSSLSRRLRENRETAMSHLDNIIKKYAELQDDGEEDTRMKTRRGTERSKQSSSEASEEEEESEDSETDIEEELEQSNEMPDSEEGENEEEEIPADQENDADQKMEMASGGEEDGEKEKEDGDEENDNVTEEQEEATEQESSPASTSLSHDKDSPNTTLESEAEAQLSGSPDLPAPSSDSPAKAKSDDELSEEDCAAATNTGDQMEEEDERSDSAPSPAGKGLRESADPENMFLSCESSDVEVDTGTHKSLQKYLLPDMTVSLVGKDKENPKQDADDVPEPDPSREGSDAGSDSERSRSPVEQEESCTDVNAEEPCKRRSSIDSEAASMEEEPDCTDPAVNHDDDVDETAASGDERTSDSPAIEREVTATSVQTETTDLDTCEKKKDCDLSPLGSSNGVHVFTPPRGTALNRLKLNKATHRDSPKHIKTEAASPVSNRKRKSLSSENWTKNNGLSRYNGKEYTQDHLERKRKKAKMDSSYTSLSSSSESDSDPADNQTPGLMMTCSPQETPKKTTRKPTKKSHVSTQCDPDEVIVLSD